MPYCNSNCSLIVCCIKQYDDDDDDDDDGALGISIMLSTGLIDRYTAHRHTTNKNTISSINFVYLAEIMSTLVCFIFWPKLNKILPQVL